MVGAERFDDGGGGVQGSVVPRLLGREQATSRLLALDERGELTTAHVRLVASSVGVSLRTVWRWLDAARQGRVGRLERDRFRITPELHARLAAWCGNAAAVHRELVAEAAAARAKGHQAQAVPSLATLHRAIRLDLNAGQRAALAGGERARRRHDVHLRRPRQWRNTGTPTPHPAAPRRERVCDPLPSRLGDVVHRLRRRCGTGRGDHAAPAIAGRYLRPSFEAVSYQHWLRSDG
ncbi:hypothetical protein [Streptomyces sp. NBC_00145]|uniref:hypothetical protein n=1 Tax=Streptomyces sp. NBC_00145 TaxID=2975666 RepID=UPI002E17B599